ncbi:unnamed protein product [Pseudo-nitzschia multistriata]|uniref:Dirigent protein n=1 Tax=Pseudo-nitzschia multistriata TaxID=183589 RepID=A0A448ZBF9_9STRA|nr:unnamed protein product [Pseudo-nitzschia multistriata]
MSISSSKTLKAFLAVVFVIVAFSSPSHGGETKAPKKKSKASKKNKNKKSNGKSPKNVGGTNKEPPSLIFQFDSVRMMSQGIITLGNEVKTIDLNDPTSGVPSMMGATIVNHFSLFRIGSINKDNVASKATDASAMVGRATVTCTVTDYNPINYEPEQGNCMLAFDFELKGVNSSIIGLFSGDINPNPNPNTSPTPIYQGVISGGTGNLLDYHSGYFNFDRTIFDPIDGEVYVLEQIRFYPKKNN